MFKAKLNYDGSIEQHKACLVAKGFTQKKSFNYYETYAPVACMASICIIAAIAANNGWKLLQIDITSAYLNGKIDCDIYMSQPPSYIDENNPLKVWLLLKSLYSLKQAGKIFINMYKNANVRQRLYKPILKQKSNQCSIPKLILCVQVDQDKNSIQLH